MADSDFGSDVAPPLTLPSYLPANVQRYMQSAPSIADGSGLLGGMVGGFGTADRSLPQGRGWQFPGTMDRNSIWNDWGLASPVGPTGSDGRVLSAGMVQLPDGRWVQPPPQVPPNWQQWLQGLGMGGGLSPMSMTAPGAMPGRGPPYNPPAMGGAPPGGSAGRFPPYLPQGMETPDIIAPQPRRQDYPQDDEYGRIPERGPALTPLPGGGGWPISMRGGLSGGVPRADPEWGPWRKPPWSVDPPLPLGQRHLPGTADQNVMWPPRSVPPGWPGGEL